MKRAVGAPAVYIHQSTVYEKWNWFEKTSSN